LLQQATLSLRSRAWDDKKITAHHAIIPTASPPQLARLSQEEMLLYDLIRRHYLAQFFPPFAYDQTVIEIRIAGFPFRATGRVEVAAGWQQLLRPQKGDDPPGEKEHAPTTPLPPVKPGEPALVTKSEVAEKRTQPPHRFTEGTLIQAMKQVGKSVDDPRLKKILRETAGIGTEATRAAIIENLLKRQLLAKEGKKGVISTETGRMLVDLLPHSVTDPATTAVWEQALDDIAQGESSLAIFQDKAVLWVTKLVSQVKGRCMSGNTPPPPLTAMAAPACPLCGRPMRRRQSARGWFMGCSGYPACKAILPEQADQLAAPLPAPAAGQPCPACKTGHLVKRTATQGKNKGHPFVGCSHFPKCRYTASTGERTM
jgi:DNA topoisomerase-3